MNTKTTTAYDQLLFDTFVTALEGGINYWAAVGSYRIWRPGTNYEEDTRGFHAVIVDAEETASGTHVIDRTVMAKGLRLAATEWRDTLAWSDGKPPLVVTDDTDWVPDAGDADMVVQLGLFGDVVYG